MVVQIGIHGKQRLNRYGGRRNKNVITPRYEHFYFYGDPLRPVKYRDTPYGDPEATVDPLRIP